MFVGYRYYDSKEVKPLFPFGYGLSYTNFKYSNLTISKKEITDEDILEVSVKVRNTGDMAGKEVVQLYVKDVESSVNRPEKELKGFEKVYLEAGEEKTVHFTLDKRSFAYYNVDLADWHVETGGDFDILIGSSSQEILLKERVKVTSTVTLPFIVNRNTLVGDLLSNPTLAPVARELLAKNNPFADMNSSEGQDDASEMMVAMMQNMPLRAMVNFSMGAFTNEMLEQLINELNQI
ncbi:beta-glucosidase [Gracilibacillus boraciitolerans JCM 21714]|uniref:Beta-glucosidase n=2 Tax=Gracilibacillus boraciitolerans TaxID=307521 RepID=W4VJP9_9BACI|nr:beta-glucosidase [Gracilibacillus boraciitolerans JCM 21714]